MNYCSKDSSQSKNHWHSNSVGNGNSPASGSARGWHRYKKSLCEAKVLEKTHRWYVRHVQAFLKSHPGCRLSDLTPDVVNQHLQQLGTRDFRQAWQQAQYIDAIEILLTDTAKVCWVSEIPWAELKSSVHSIHPNHAKLARETDGHNAVVPVFSMKLPESHQDSLRALVEKIRVSQYSIRTEQTYCH